MQSIDIFPWDNHFKTGLDTIDEQHRKLVEILNRLATNVAFESNEKELGDIFDELVEYTLYHFKTEEAIWDKYFLHDSMNEEHQAVHQQFVDTALHLKAQQDIKPLAELADEALGFLAKWLASHILDTDRHMAYIVFAIQDSKSLEEAKVVASEKMNGSSRLLINIILSIYSTLSSNTLSLMRELKAHRVFERKVNYQEEYRQLLLNLSTSFINLPPNKIDIAIQNSLQSMATFVGADRAYIFDYNIDAQTTTNTYEWCSENISSEINNLQNLPIDTLGEWLDLHRKGEYVLIQDVQGLPQGYLHDILVPQKIQSLVTIPLMSGDVCKGFVGFDAVKTKHHFSKNEIELLELFSNMLVNVDERKHVESALSHERSFLKTLIKTIPDLVWLKDTEGTYLACNTRFEDFFGAKEIDIIGKSDYHFVDKELADFFRKNDKIAMQKAKASVNEEELIFASDGHKEMLETTKVPMYDAQGELIGVLGIARDITERQQHQHHLEYIAHYDALTGLPNRVLLLDRIHQALAQRHRHNLSLAVVYLDLDGFKAINDRHGHDNGDKFLAIIAQEMKNALRDGDTIARLGGDEFVAVLLDLKTHEDSIPMLKRLLKACSQKILVDDIEIQVTASLGVTFFEADDDINADQLLRQADQAMYQAKLLGKNRYYIFDALKDKRIRTYHESLDEIEMALVNNEFVLYYQPKVNMRSGEVVGAEALIRWNHPERGILAPGIFLPVIQGHFLSVKLGEWVLNSAMQQIKEFKENGINLPISINVDAMQLQQNDFLEQLVNILNKYPTVKSEDLILEVLETSALEDIVHISQIMQACSEIGISFSLDDFGTGYSSLTYLKRLPAKELKIDRSFVSGMLEDQDDLAIIDGILGLSSAFRRKVIAEGVESIEHGEMLLKLGCEIAQGYVIAHPMPAENILSWIEQYKPDEKWKNVTPISRDELPLLYALVEHKAWLKNVCLYLKDMRNTPPKLNHKECRFGGWLYEEGVQRYAKYPVFKELERLHNVLHEITNTVADKYENNSLENLDASIDEIEKSSKDLIDAFKKFEAVKSDTELLKL